MRARRGESTTVRVWAAWVWATLVSVGGILGGSVALMRGVLGAEAIGLVVLSIVYAGLGVLLAVRTPGNRVAWLLLIVGSWIVSSGAATVAVSDLTERPDDPSFGVVLAIVWDNTGYFVGLLFPLLLFFYLFPTGRFLTPRWSWAGWVAGLTALVVLIGGGLAKEVGPYEAGWVISNPIGVFDSSVDEGLVSALLGVGLGATFLGAIAAIIVRYRRADVVVRTQVKWVVYGLMVAALSLLAISTLRSVLPEWSETVGYIALLAAVPASIVLAILRYRLYEIDRVISRTVGYLLVVAALGLVYVAGAVWLPSQVLDEQSAPLTAMSTLAVAALFNPARRTILGRVDRRFNRASYDAQRVLEEFVSDMSDATEIDHVTEGSVAVIDGALKPESVAVWIASAPDEGAADASPGAT